MIKNKVKIIQPYRQPDIDRCSQLKITPMIRVRKLLTTYKDTAVRRDLREIISKKT